MSVRRCLFWLCVGYLLARGALVIKPRAALQAFADAVSAIVHAGDRGAEGQPDAGARDEAVRR